jgi:hypothetical protein
LIKWFSGKGISSLATMSPAFTNCNYPPGSRPYFCYYFGLSGAKIRKKIEVGKQNAKKMIGNPLKKRP